MLILKGLGYFTSTLCCIRCCLDSKQKGIEYASDRLFNLNSLSPETLTLDVVEGLATEYLDNQARKTHHLLLSNVHRLQKENYAYLNTEQRLSIIDSYTLLDLQYFSAIATYQIACHNKGWITKYPTLVHNQILSITLPTKDLILYANIERVIRVALVIFLLITDLCLIIVGKTDFKFTKGNYQMLGDITDALGQYKKLHASARSIDRSIR
jgi:hypothetical protein